MDEEQKEEETPAESEPALENQEETEPESEAPVEEQELSDEDFQKELETLEQPKRTELEKAVHTRDQIDRRIVELGGQSRPSKKEVDTSNFVTKEDLAVQRIDVLAKSESERKVILWHYRNSIQRTGNIHEDVDNAYWISHKGRIRKTYEELDRIETPKKGGGAGQRIPSKPRIPDMPQDQQRVLQRRGYRLNQQGEWEAKFNKMVWNGSQWVSVKK